MTPLKTILVLLIAILMSGCSWPRQHRVAPAHNKMHPTDLSISMHVIGEPGPTHPLRRTSMFVLEPNRSLYAGIGLKVDRGYRPPLLGRITTSQFDSIVRIVLDRNLIAEPTSPNSQKDQHPPVVYEVEITAWGMINRYRTTPEESPPTAKLLTKLIIAAGGEVLFWEKDT